MSGTMQAAIFRVGTEQFALDISAIREITRLESVTKVPHMPNFVEGVMELRGMIIPIVDLRKRMDAEIHNTRQTRIIVSRLQGKPLGLIVDEVTDVWEIETSDIAAAPSVGSSFRPGFLDGVFKRDDRIVFFLCFEQLLSTTELAKVDEVRTSNKKKSTKPKKKKGSET